MKWLRGLVVAALCLAPISAGAWWQSVAQQSVGAAPSYVGPGDVVSGALEWGSCARVYNAALATTSTSLCDLVDTTTGAVAICTLRGSASGFVDLAGAYCTGSTTPAVACAAAAGGACRVSKVYDQIGGTSGWANATNSQRFILTFSALNGLPGLTGAGASNSFLASSGAITQAQPFSFSLVYERTGAFTTDTGIFETSAAGAGVHATATINTVGAGASCCGLTATAADSAFHAVNILINGASSAINVDGADSSGNAGATNLTGQTFRIGRSAGGVSLTGIIMEVGLWGVGFTPTNRTDLNSNQHGTNGYNF